MHHPADLYSDYNYALIFLALLVATVASSCALETVAYAAGCAGVARQRWLLVGTGILGLGVWTMHFIGMLAFSADMPVGYHLPTVALSMLPAVAAAALALGLTSGETLTAGRLWGGGVLMALGIGAMHYSGMFAMRMQAVTYYDPWWLLGSVVFAVAASLLSLYMAFSVRGEADAGVTRALAGFVMGTAITGLHFAAMFYASHFAPATDTTGHLLTTPWTNAAPTGPLVVQIPVGGAAALALLVFGAVTLALGRLRAARGAALPATATSGAD